MDANLCETERRKVAKRSDMPLAFALSLLLHGGLLLIPLPQICTSPARAYLGSNLVMFALESAPRQTPATTVPSEIAPAFREHAEEFVPTEPASPKAVPEPMIAAEPESVAAKDPATLPIPEPTATQEPAVAVESAVVPEPESTILNTVADAESGMTVSPKVMQELPMQAPQAQTETPLLVMSQTPPVTARSALVPLIRPVAGAAKFATRKVPTPTAAVMPHAAPFVSLSPPDVVAPFHPAEPAIELEPAAETKPAAQLGMNMPSAPSGFFNGYGAEDTGFVLTEAATVQAETHTIPQTGAAALPPGARVGTSGGIDRDMDSQKGRPKFSASIGTTTFMDTMSSAGGNVATGGNESGALAAIPIRLENQESAQAALAGRATEKAPAVVAAAATAPQTASALASSPPLEPLSAETPEPPTLPLPPVPPPEPVVPSMASNEIAMPSAPMPIPQVSAPPSVPTPLLTPKVPAPQVPAPEEVLVLLTNLIAERKVYPEAARRRKAQGEVGILLKVAPDGALVAASLEKKSGSAILDRAALDLVKGIFPISLRPGTLMEITLSIEYRIVP